MGDEAHIRLVNAHAEGDGSDHHDAIFAQKTGLVPCPGGRIQTGVIRQGRDALRLQVFGGLLDTLSAECVDDPGGTVRLRSDEAQQLFARVELRLDLILNVRSIKTRHKHFCAMQRQALDDLGPGLKGGGGRQRHTWHAREPFAECAEVEIVRTEVVPPLRNTVRLVNRDHAELAARSNAVVASRFNRSGAM